MVGGENRQKKNLKPNTRKTSPRVAAIPEKRGKGGRGKIRSEKREIFSVFMCTKPETIPTK
jgi:hypothetical protein